MTREEAIKTLKRIIEVANTSDCGIKEIDGIDEEALNMAIKALGQESTAVALLERTYADFCKCEGGEGWLKMDDKEYYTDVGYALEGMSIFLEIFKRRLAEREDKDASSN